LNLGERLLWRGDQVVPLTPKAFEMLLVLVESSGHVLTKDELLKRVWPDTIVEEANLSHNIYKLREALAEGSNGEKYIETLPRRGYRFVAKVTEVHHEDSDLIVAEELRTHIVIEEEHDTDSSTVNLPAGVVEQPSQMRASIDALAQAVPIGTQRRDRGLLILLVGALLIGGVAGSFALYRSFKASRGVKAEREMTITRVTNS
jgi:DNA-binding winged helix-turn-helix (wHTH) protein